MNFLSCFAVCLLGDVLSPTVFGQVEFDFPDKDVPVLRVDEYYREANKDKRPTMLLYSDGRVIRPVSDDEKDDYQCTLSPQKLQSVLKEIFTTQDFSTISEEKILDEVSTPRRRKRPSSTSFRVTTNTGQGTHAVSFGNSWLHDRLGLGRKRHEGDEHLQRFLDVEEACREISHLALVGGEKALQSATEQAQAKFKAVYPDGPTITDKHLFSVRLNSDGRVAVRFIVPRKIVEPDPVSVWVYRTKGKDELSVEIKVDVPRAIR